MNADETQINADRARLRSMRGSSGAPMCTKPFWGFSAFIRASSAFICVSRSNRANARRFGARSRRALACRDVGVSGARLRKLHAEDRARDLRAQDLRGAAGDREHPRV